MPDHDFFPFVPNCGRVVGHNHNGQAMPTYLFNGLSLCKPYILPYGKPHEWASILEKKEVDFSIFCFKETISMFEEMEKLNNTKLTLEILLNTYPRASLPSKSAVEGFPSIKTRIVDILHRDLNKLIS